MEISFKDTSFQSDPNGRYQPISPKVLLERLPEVTQDVIFRLRCLPSPCFEYINPAIKSYTGYTPEEYYQNPELIFRTTHFSDLKILEQILAGYQTNAPIQMRWVHRDGTTVWIELISAPILDDSGTTTAIECSVRKITLNHNDLSFSGLETQRKRLLNLAQSIGLNFSVTEVMRHLLQTLEEFLNYTHCIFWIREEDSFPYTLLSQVQEEFASKNVYVKKLNTSALEEYQVMVSGKVKLNQKDQLLMLPMQANGNTIGVFSAYRKNQKPYSEEDLELCQLCISYASLAIENAHLCKNGKNHWEFYRKIKPKTEALDHSFTLSELGEAIGQEALQISKADRVVVLSQWAGLQISKLWSHGLSTGYLHNLTASRNGFYEHKYLEATELVQISDIQGQPNWSSARDAAVTEGYHSLFILPLLIGNISVASVVGYYDQSYTLSGDEINDLMEFSHQAAITLENTRLFNELEDSYLQTVSTLTRILNARDEYTADHSQRLAGWAEETARRLNCAEEEVQVIRWAAMLHDIGKIGIPDSILRKAGPLTAEEWEIMRQHPTIGADIIAPMKYLQPISSIIRHHQEKYDGTGYPDGLHGEQIPLAARIITVVDAFGAMTDERVYRRACTKEEATAELKRCAGTHFDSKIVNVFSDYIASEYIN